MKYDKSNFLLYAVTDRRWLGKRSLTEAVEESIKGDVTFVQLREKDLDPEAFLNEAAALKKVCEKYGVPFVINDDVEIAKAVNADGVHVGQSDMEVGKVRAVLGADKIIGVSVQTTEQAILAESRGADYLGVGAVFATGTKSDAVDVSYETLKSICGAVSIPVIAIGGINAENVSKLRGSGICGAAVVSAIFAEKDICGAARKLRSAVENTVNQ